jgi:hypothetical protein
LVHFHQALLVASFARGGDPNAAPPAQCAADLTEKDVDAALKVLVAQERAAFFNLSTNNGVKSGWVRLMKEGDV